MPTLPSDSILPTIYLYTGGRSLHAVWIPVHVGIQGNERSDQEAVNDRANTNKILVSLSKHDMKSAHTKVTIKKTKIN